MRRMAPSMVFQARDPRYQQSRRKSRRTTAVASRLFRNDCARSRDCAPQHIAAYRLQPASIEQPLLQKLVKTGATAIADGRLVSPQRWSQATKSEAWRQSGQQPSGWGGRGNRGRRAEEERVQTWRCKQRRCQIRGGFGSRWCWRRDERRRN